MSGQATKKVRAKDIKVGDIIMLDTGFNMHEDIAPCTVLALRHTTKLFGDGEELCLDVRKEDMSLHFVTCGFADDHEFDAIVKVERKKRTKKHITLNEYRVRVALHATFLLRQFRFYPTDSGGWLNREMRQGLRDALESLKRHGLIVEYSLLGGIVTLLPKSGHEYHIEILKECSASEQKEIYKSLKEYHEKEI